MSQLVEHTVIVFLLIVIIVILLFGAAAVKAAVFRNLALMASLVPLVILFQMARTVPVWVWPVLVASVVAGILGLDQWQKARWRREEAENLRGYGLNEDEIARHQALGKAGDFRAQTEVFSAAVSRVAQEKLGQGGPFDASAQPVDDVLKEIRLIIDQEGAIETRT